MKPAKYSVRTVSSGRGISDYQRGLEINLSKFPGRQVLDIGAGFAEFQKQLKQEGIDIISLDALYRKPRYNNHWLQDKSGKIAAVCELLPFADKTFDTVLGLYSPFYHIDSTYPEKSVRKEMAREMLEEAVRILMPGGEARLGIKFEDLENFYKPILREISKTLSLEFSWEIRETPHSCYIFLQRSQD